MREALPTSSETPAALTAAELEAVLETEFQRIQQLRMDGVPVINDRLQVRAVGFRPWGEHWLGILLTPWFMNVLLIPRENRPDGEHWVGSVRAFQFPSGQYDFVAAYEERLGGYYSCSLFSPMFEFDSQEAAELTAEAALAAMMDEENVDTSSQSRREEIEQIWRGEKPRPAGTLGAEEPGEAAPAAPRKPLSERLQEPVSRRDFLRGKIFSDDEAAGSDAGDSQV